MTDVAEVASPKPRQFLLFDNEAVSDAIISSKPKWSVYEQQWGAAIGTIPCSLQVVNKEFYEFEIRWRDRVDDLRNREMDHIAAHAARMASKANAIEALLQKLLNKVNVVTAEYRHTGELGKIWKNSINNLIDRQIEVERALSLIQGGHYGEEGESRSPVVEAAQGTDGKAT